MEPCHTVRIRPGDGEIGVDFIVFEWLLLFWREGDQNPTHFWSLSLLIYGRLRVRTHHASS